jgi:hypothetical protein
VLHYTLSSSLPLPLFPQFNAEKALSRFVGPCAATATASATGMISSLLNSAVEVLSGVIRVIEAVSQSGCRVRKRRRGELRQREIAGGKEELALWWLCNASALAVVFSFLAGLGGIVRRAQVKFHLTRSLWG